MLDASYNGNNESGGTSGGLETRHYNKEFFTRNRGDHASLPELIKEAA